MRRCRYCNRALRKVMSPKAKYCSASCRVMACQQRAIQRKRVESASRSVQGWAPEKATGYCLGISKEQGGEIVWFPRHGTFSVKPFEPPRVPIMGVYTIRFFDADLNRVRTPRALAAGILIRNPDPRVDFY